MTWSSAKPGRVHTPASLGAALRAWAPEELGAGAGDAFVADGERPLADAPPHAAPREPGAELAAAERRARAAEAEADELRAAYDAALAEAHAHGFAAGERAEGARLRTAVTAATQALDDLRAGETRWTGTIEENVCALAVAVARQIIGREPAADGSAVVELVRHAVSEFTVDQPMVVRVSPPDLAAIERAAGEEGAVRPALGDVRWVADPRIAPGGCLVEGRERIVDGRVDTGLERVYRRLTYTNA